MMTARQFANKYPGQIVRTTAKFAKEFGIIAEPIGIVVGFKVGKLGVVGSSKVAIYRDKFELKNHLGPRTDTKYNAVVLNAPTRDKGLYFLSVDQLELVNPAKPLKDVVPYPDECAICHSPARKGGSATVCSNDRCKSKRAALDAYGPYPKFKTVDKEGFVLCPTCQVNDLEFDGKYGNDQKYLICRKNAHTFAHHWKDGQKMRHRGTNTYVWKNKQLQQYRG